MLIECLMSEFTRRRPVVQWEEAQWQGAGDGMGSEHVLLGDRPHLPPDRPYREPRVWTVTAQAGGPLPPSLAPLVQESIWHRPGDLRCINKGHDPAWGHFAGPSYVQGSEAQGGSWWAWVENCCSFRHLGRLEVGMGVGSGHIPSSLSS